MVFVAVRNLLSDPSPDGKLGGSIFGWSIPAVRTCPGRTSVCESVCYATHGRFCTKKVVDLNEWRYEQSKRSDFADAMSDEIFRRGVIVLRVHVSGDFYSPAYTTKWIEVATRNPHTTLFCYSRSWRIDKIRALLAAFAALENVQLWYSADCDSGYPPEVPERVRVAWLQHSPLPAPENVDLVFQTRKQRARPGQVSLPMVCSQETPEGKAKGVNCSNCTVCWKS